NISQSVLDKDRIQTGGVNTADLELLNTIGRHMSTLLDTILDMERMKENLTVLHLETRSIHNLAEVVIDMVRFLTEGKTIKLLNKIPDDFPLVYADKNRLIQILFNLLHNAVKHSQADIVTVSASQEGQWAKISVSDN